MNKPKLLYRSTFALFLEERFDELVNRMAAALARKFGGIHRDAIDAWQQQLPVLRCAIERLVTLNEGASAWGLALEYPLYRIGKRIDAVLITPNAVLVLEFKKGSGGYEASGREQVEDYSLDLYDFHSASHKRTIIPVLVAVEADRPPSATTIGGFGVVWPVSFSNGAELPEVAARLVQAAPLDPSPLAANPWIDASYRPTPSILEAARSLYAGHDVREITYTSSDVHNLGSTTDAVRDAVAKARADQALTVCFVTGTPGSGKTLVGLNVVHDSEIMRSASRAAYLSGTRPLVEVLRESLASDHSQRNECSLKDSRRDVQPKVQPLMGYLKEYVARKPQDPPDENVIVFDEAQRAWDADFGLKRFERADSEPALFLDIMARRPEWAVIVALVGNGQEINKGEGGLAEWGKALRQWAAKNPGRKWRVALSANDQGSPGGLSDLWSDGPSDEVSVEHDRRLHLVGSARSHRFVGLHSWVDAVLDGDAAQAAEISSASEAFPIRLTRSLSQARQWLRQETRGKRRCGLVASSGARRLRAHGLGVALRSNDLSATVDWYLKPASDIRSSHALETTVSEYTCQGLEIDLVGLCWGGDLLWDAARAGWGYCRLSGTKWQKIGKQEQRDYLLNKYRVLLTRARQETIIWVPRGEIADSTRNPAPLDATAEFLQSAGARPL